MLFKRNQLFPLLPFFPISKKFSTRSPATILENGKTEMKEYYSMLHSLSPRDLLHNQISNFKKGKWFVSI